MFRLLSRYWWVFVVRGVVATLFGICAFVMPIVTLAALVLLFGAYAIVDGVVAIATAFSGRQLSRDWWILLVQGVLGIGVGLLTLVTPGITALALLFYIAAWAVFVGVFQVAAAFRLPHAFPGEWGFIVGGLLAIGFGVLLMWSPGAGALALLWLIATYAIGWGIVLIVGGFELHHASTHVPI